MRKFLLTLGLLLACVAVFRLKCHAAEQNLLYVAAPGIRDYLEYGGHGLLVFDIDNEHQFVKRVSDLVGNGGSILYSGRCIDP